jgi:hypothetical protein
MNPRLNAALSASTEQLFAGMMMTMMMMMIIITAYIQILIELDR